MVSPALFMLPFLLLSLLITTLQTLLDVKKTETVEQIEVHGHSEDFLVDSAQHEDAQQKFDQFGDHTADE
jgi:hypothetical protein